MRRGAGARPWHLVILALAVALLAGCSLFRSKKPPASPPPQATVKPLTSLSVDLATSCGVNPDDGGKANPVVVRIYQLREDSAWTRAGFFDLYDNEAAAIGAALVSREERVLLPDQLLHVSAPMSPETRYVAVAAAFRDIDKVRWRFIIKRPTAPLWVRLSGSGLELIGASAEEEHKTQDGS